MARGAVLAMAEELFPEGIPTVASYAQKEGVAPSTFRRAGGWLLEEIRPLLAGRRPGPGQEDLRGGEEKRAEAVKLLEALRTWLLEKRSPTEKNNCYSPEAKLRIAESANGIQASGVMTFAEIAQTLQVNERQLFRIREEVALAEGKPPQPESRRPNSPKVLAPEIQKLIKYIQKKDDTRHPYTPTDVKRILEKTYRVELEKYHGGKFIKRDTVAKYMGLEVPEEKDEHPRGSYVYPQPFQEVAIDTSHFKLFGRTFYLITVFELGGRLNLITRVFLKENVQAVVRVIEEFLARFPGVGVVVMDRGTPYLNEEVKRILEEKGLVRLVCPPATPTAKAACERHFATLKKALRSAIERVFPEDPCWEPRDLTKVLEMGVAVFQELYHRIPQEGIDGKSPGERAMEFDPVKACERMAELFQRSLDSEPADEYARELHLRFQLPGEIEKTVEALRRFGTKCLRKLAATVGPYMGPPHPKWMYDPLGYLTVKAREISETEWSEVLREKYRETQRKRFEEEAKKENEKRRVDEEEREEHPERFVDRAILTLGKCIKNGWTDAIEWSWSLLKKLLVSLAAQMKGAFALEVERFRGKVASLALNDRAREGLNKFLEEFFAEWRVSGGVPDG